MPDTLAWKRRYPSTWHDAGRDGHQILDLGDDFYTVGRPHPMIDPTLRNLLIADLGAKPQVRVLLLDVVIGFGATADPAASLVSAWQKACAARSDNQHCMPLPR
mgnify:CR=1 FL=1